MKVANFRADLSERRRENCFGIRQRLACQGPALMYRAVLTITLFTPLDVDAFDRYRDGRSDAPAALRVETAHKTFAQPPRNRKTTRVLCC